MDRFADYLTAERIPFKTFETIEIVIANLASEPDAILVIEIGGFGKRQSVVRLIEYLSARAGVAILTFVCVAALDSIEHRLAATRAGAAAFFSDSVTPEYFIAKLTELNVDATETPSRILVVDDSPMGATTTTEILNRSGFETRRLDSPLDLIDVAQAFHPDLVLMDTELADVNGFELAQVLREHDTLFATPIVLLGAPDGDTEAARSSALRSGGDDFLIKPPTPATLIEVVDCWVLRFRRLRQNLKLQAKTNNAVVPLRTPGNTVTAAVEMAEERCIRAQEHSDNLVEIHTSAKLAGPSRQKINELKSLIERGLKSCGFQLHCQPIMALRKQPGGLYDALLRLTSASGETFQPPEFLPIAQEHGLMQKVDRWVMESALDMLKQQHDAEHDMRIFVHQTMSTIESERWISWVSNQLAERNVENTKLILQFSLSDVLENLQTATVRFEALHELGIRLCVTGFDDRRGGITMLETQPVSVVKLALELIQHQNRERLLQLNERIHDLGCAIIAVGIEDPQSIAPIMECGADFIQGEFIQPPRDGFHFDFEESVG